MFLTVYVEKLSFKWIVFKKEEIQNLSKLLDLN